MPLIPSAAFFWRMAMLIEESDELVREGLGRLW